MNTPGSGLASWFKDKYSEYIASITLQNRTLQVHGENVETLGIHLASRCTGERLRCSTESCLAPCFLELLVLRNSGKFLLSLISTIFFETKGLSLSLGLDNFSSLAGREAPVEALSAARCEGSRREPL